MIFSVKTGPLLSCFLIFLLSMVNMRAAGITSNLHVINEGNNYNFFSEKASSLPNLGIAYHTFHPMEDAAGSKQDSLILVGFVNSDFFGGLFWTVKWDLTQPMDTWAGVTLNEDRRVVGLELSNRNINAEIPPSFGNLSELKTLIIEDEDDIDGRIPKELGNLAKLEILRINNTEVTGPIPTTFGQLSSLQELDLSDNLLHGLVPPALANLSQLTTLRLTNNKFSGDLPETLSNLTNLQDIEISENLFTYLPDMTVPSPATFNVQHNKLTFESLLPNIGILDTYIPQDSIGVAHSINLIVGESFILDLQIDEEVTDNVYTWFKDGEEVLQTNEHTFTFENVTDDDEGVYTCAVTNPGVPGFTLFSRPVTLNVVNSCTERDSLAVLDVLHAVGTPRSLFDFDLENDPLEEWKWITLDENRCVESLSISLGNDIYITPRTDGKGYISPAIGDLTNLRRLRIYDIGTEEEEGIYGTLPPETGKLVNLDTLIIWGEYLSGEIPDEFSSLTNLRYLWLDIRRLSGNIPDYIGTFSSLTYLVLKSNLTGEIPLSFQNLTQMEWLDLSRNQLTGNIPEIFGSMGNLRGLYLGSNQLTGTIPDQIWNLTNLTSLHLSSNQLTGSIPEALGNLTELLFLQLENNQFTGTIPSSLGNLTKLRNLFLSNNQFTGSIPEGIGNLLDMNYFYVNNNQLSGTLPESIGNLDESLLWVHLENNQLSGEIPDGIENWTGVIDFYAHNNQFSGEIPATIGNMEKLRILSLHHNQLSGLPREIGNLENLSTIWLGDNQLSGAVPAELGMMVRLGWLHLQNNQFTSIETGFTIENPEADFQISKFRIENNLLTGLPDLSGMARMMFDTTSVFGNQLTFEDILPNMALAEEAFQPRFYYAPQDSIGEELEVRLNQGDIYTIDLGIDEDIEDNVYQWFQDGVEVQTTNVNALVLENLTAEDAGVYTAEVTNPGVPNLTLVSHPVTIFINAPPVFTSTPVTEATVGADYAYDITTTDPDGDALTIATTTLPAWAEFTDNGDGTASFQGTPQLADCGNGQVTLVVADENGLTSEQSFTIDISTTFTVEVKSDRTAICAGEPVTFTAMVTDEGSNPVYEWFLDDELASRTENSTFTTNAIRETKMVKVKVTIEPTACITNTEAESSPLSIEVKESLAMSVTADVEKTTICEGESVTFTAIVTDGGANPVYEWFINGQTVTGETGATFTTDQLADGDAVKVQVNTDAAECLASTQAESEPVSIIVTERLTMSVVIQAERTTICQGEEVTFTAEPTNAGPNPQFTWNVNDNPVGVVGGETFTTDLLSDGDVVSVEVNTDASACIANTTASAEVTMTVSEGIILAVTLSSDKTGIAAGETVNFTASTDYTGSAVQYEWFINEQVVDGETAATFATNTLQNNDQVKVKIIAEPITCLENTEAESEAITITVNENNEVFVQDFDKPLDEDTRLTFTSDNFVAAFSATNELVTLRITTLPGKGTLSLNGSNIAVNQEIEVSQLSGLVYTPDPDVNGEDAFGWNGSDGSSFAENDASVNMTIRPVNDPPDFTLSGDVLVSKNFTTVEQVTVIPEEVPLDEINQTVTYQLIPPTVSFATIIFDPQSGRVAITSVLDQTGKQEFEIVANDGQVENNIHIESFILEVKSANVFPPKDIAADNLFIPENQPRGTLIGTITVTDDDPDDRHVLTLDDNNTDFFIDGNQLKTNAVLDFEQKATYEVKVRATDLGGNFLVEPFTITVTDENDPPTDLEISAHEIVENEPIGTQIGKLTAIDQDAGDVLRYTLVADEGDNSFFSISENVLVSEVVFDFEERTTYEIHVRAEDGNGGVIEEVITIAVIDVEPEEIEIISGFTPDNDRMNDTWEIPGLVSYPRCTVAVYNSWGQQVFFSRGYQRPWDGTYKNNDVPVGTYYYIIDLDNGEPPITGDITVMR